MLDLLVLVLGLTLLIALILRGKAIEVAAPLCALGLALASGVDVLEAMTGHFVSGFAKYLADFLFIFLLGGSFGKLMEDSMGAKSLASAVTRGLGSGRALLAVILCCALLTYGGVSLFVVGFAVYPLALHLFQAANLPRRFIPGAMAFGSVTFTMTSAGSPEIQNLIPIRLINDAIKAAGLDLKPTDAMAGWPASLVVAFTLFFLGWVYLEWHIARALRNGESFESREGEGQFVERRGLPASWVCILPLLGVLASLDIWRLDPVASLFIGNALILALSWKRLRNPWRSLASGFQSGLTAAAATCFVVGFGNVVRNLPVFSHIRESVLAFPGDPLLAAALAVAAICAVTGSASGGQVIALPILAKEFLLRGVAPRALHRVVSISSGTLDSLPHCGYVVTLINVISRETYSRAYLPVFVTTVLLPILGTALAILLFHLFPSWGYL